MRSRSTAGRLFVTAVSVTAGERLVQAMRVAADGADGDAALGMQFEEAGAAVGAAVQLRRGHRASAHAPDRGRSSCDGRLMGTREHVVVRFLWSRSRAVWALDGDRVACRGLGEWAVYVPRGRGSESGEFLDSGDAQTCCPLFGIQLTTSSMGSIPCRVKSSQRNGSGSSRRFDRSEVAEGPAERRDSRVITQPHPGLGCRFLSLLRDSAPQNHPCFGAT